MIIYLKIFQFLEPEPASLTYQQHAECLNWGLRHFLCAGCLIVVVISHILILSGIKWKLHPVGVKILWTHTKRRGSLRAPGMHHTPPHIRCPCRVKDHAHTRSAAHWGKGCVRWKRGGGGASTCQQDEEQRDEELQPQPPLGRLWDFLHRTEKEKTALYK